jgi:hypothetical protein
MLEVRYLQAIAWVTCGPESEGATGANAMGLERYAALWGRLPVPAGR